jgi:Na+/H+ antiporter NhaC
MERVAEEFDVCNAIIVTFHVADMSTVVQGISPWAASTALSSDS